MERFLAEVCTPVWHDPHDRGEPTTRSCAELAARHPEWAELIWAWATCSEEMVAGPIEESVEVLRDLKMTGLPCYALTNMEAETYPLRLERFAFLGWFEGTVVSGFERIAKPDVEIFARLLERFNLTASHTLMIDDRLENLAAAERLGMTTLQYHSPLQLRNQLECLSVLEPQPLTREVSHSSGGSRRD